MKNRTVFVAALVLAAGSVFAEEKPGTANKMTQAGSAAASQAALIKPMPDLVVHLTAYPQAGISYPYASFYVENKGNADSTATTVQVTCKAYKGANYYKKCSETGKLNVPALPAPTKPSDPKSLFSPQLPFTPGPIRCDQWNDQTKTWAGITKCVMVAEVDPDKQVAESNKGNNKVTVTVTVPPH